MKSPLLLGLLSTSLLSVTVHQGWAQVTPAPLATSPYSQNFDGLAASGTTNTKTTLPTGWDFLEVNGTGTSANDQYAADNGASSTGNTYSYGATSGSDRAFGALLSGAQSTVLGGAFINNTGAALSSLTITYAGETWRVGGTGRSDKLSFQYSTDATSLSTGTWTDVTALDYANPSATAVSTAGVSTPIHTATLTSTISGLNIPAGATFWIRWNDFNASGADDGMAVDDFQLSWGTANPTAPALTLSAATLAFPGQNVGTTSSALTYTVSAANLTADVTVTATGPFTISKDNTTYGTSLTLTTAELSAAKTLYVKFTPTAAGGATGSITHTSTGATTKTLALTGTGTTPGQTVFDFQTCTGGSTISDGWIQYSVSGAQTWACTTFGRDPQNPAGTTAFPSGVQINGFASGSNVLNEDWLISPALNLSATTFPLLSFWSRVAFNGPPLKLLVSTNYSGTGSPTATGVTWTDLNASFPAIGTNVWTQTANVDLSAYKQAGVYVAFVYNSTNDEGARWTLDDIAVTNSPTAPPPAIRASAPGVAFGYRAVGTTSTQTVTATFSNLTADVTVASSDPAFQVSSNGTTFSSSVTLTQAAANGNSLPITVRFSPTQATRNYSGNLTLTSTGAPTVTIPLSGNTYDVANTLEVVNWNLEWFGSPTLGPSDDNLQYNNVRTIVNSLNADVFAFAEVVDTVRLAALTAQMPGYAYKVSDFGSYADNRQDPDYAGAQKLAFVYRTSVVSNPVISSFFRCTEAQACPERNYWSSGRFPYVMTANVTLGGITKQVTFVLIHGKANTSPTQTSYDRRKAGADGLKAKLDADFPTQNFIVLGDYNDDLDQTITTGLSPATTVTSYSAFTTDPTHYVSPTLPLSLAGKKSTVSYNDVIDHVIVSDEMSQYYIPGSAEIMASAASLVSNYGNTTTDHYPVLTRYSFGTNTASTAGRTAKLGLYPNPVSKSIRVEVPERSQALQLQVLTTDGRLVISTTGSVEQLNQQLNQKVSGLHAGMYVVRIVGEQQTYVERFVKQ